MRRSGKRESGGGGRVAIEMLWSEVGDVTLGGGGDENVYRLLVVGG